MGKSSKKSINSTSNRPARRARRGTATAGGTVADLAPAAAAAAPADDVTPAVGEPAPATDAAPAPARHEVQQLAFHYYAESGYVPGNALDHWLRAESELGNS